MKNKVVLKTVSLIIGLLSLLLYVVAPVEAARRGDAIDIEALSSQMDEFSNRGAKGFLIWQYSGSLRANEFFGNDKYSFFKDEASGDAVCSLIKSKANQFDFIGVNMWDVGNAQYSSDLLSKHFSWLHDECGVSVIRTFAKAGRAEGMVKVLSVAQAHNIKIIVVVGDYSNGGGGIPQAAPESWYRNGYQNHKIFAQEIGQAVSHHPALFGIELANEPHCSGAQNEAQAIIDYTNWGKDVGGVLRQHTNMVGYGQMADENGVCDSPRQGFEPTNSISEITMTSGHHYNQQDLRASLEALEISNKIGKMFYVGEASWLKERTTPPYSEKELNDYLTIPIILQPEQYPAGEESGVGEILHNLVIDQGYEVSCASPELFVRPNAVGNLMDYFSIARNTSFPADGLLRIDGQGNHKLDMTQANIPLFRGSEASEITDKTSSYEGFFGVVNQNIDYSTYPETRSGVTTNLLSLAQQFEIKIDNMVVARDLCERLENPELCALHEQIADSPYYLYSTPSQEAEGELSLLEAIEDWAGKGSDFDVNKIAGKYQSSLPISETRFYAIKNALENAPLDLDKLYRYAFIIISPHQDVDEWCMKGESGDNFWYLNNHQFPENVDPCIPGLYINRPKRVPLFIAVKIPTTATNIIESLNLHNSASITANTLETLVNQKNKLEDLGRKSREDFLNQILDKKWNIWDDGTEEERLGLTINCHGMPQCEGAHGTSFLRLALVHIVNGSDRTCAGNDFYTSDNYQDVILSKDNPLPHGSAERAEFLGSRALYSPTDASRTFLAQYGKVEETSEGKHLWNWNMRLSREDAAKIAGSSGEDIVDESVLIHIVAPVGTELAYIESRLASLFEEAQIETMVEENVLVDTENATGGIARYFPLANIKFGFDESRGVKDYPHVDCPYKTDPVTKLPNPLLGREDCMAAGVELKDNNVGLFYPGAKLGWFIRKIQLAITEKTSLDDAYSYLESCDRIEDLFLGRCGGGDQTYGPPDGLPWAGRDVGDGWISDGRCVPITNESSNAGSPCNVENLKIKLTEYIEQTGSQPISDSELTKRATQASVICNAESSGNPNSLNDGCVRNTTLDYSVGLFQINLLAHNCPQYFTYSWGDKDADPPIPPSCSIVSPYTQNDVDQCAETLFDPDANIRKAFQLSGAGSNWWAWSTARPRHCNICSSSGVCDGVPSD